tara:strand:+ start:1083 stop:1310 length:228 start_codon:yes stop_codon:yes gene_type:complete
MKLSEEQTDIIMTALHDHSSNLYLSNNISAMTDVQNLIKEIEEEMGSETVDVGSETGIERDYYNQGKPNCEVCDD